MATDKKFKTEQEVDLEAFFAVARRDPMPSSDKLMTQVLEDALALQDAAKRAEGSVPEGPGESFFSRLWSALGGWPAASGLVTATVTGLWIGISPSLGLGDAVITAIGLNGVESYQDAFSTGFDYAFEEGDMG